MFAEEIADGLRRLDQTFAMDPNHKSAVVEPLTSTLHHVMRRIQQREVDLLNSLRQAGHGGAGGSRDEAEFHSLRAEVISLLILPCLN